MFGFLWKRRDIAAVPRSSGALRVSFLKPAPGMGAASIREITWPSATNGRAAAGGRKDARVWALRVLLARIISVGGRSARVL
jgi:hypothetical protein